MLVRVVVCAAEPRKPSAIAVMMVATAMTVAVPVPMAAMSSAADLPATQFAGEVPLHEQVGLDWFSAPDKFNARRGETFHCTGADSAGDHHVHLPLRELADEIAAVAMGRRGERLPVDDAAGFPVHLEDVKPGARPKCGHRRPSSVGTAILNMKSCLELRP